MKTLTVIAQWFAGILLLTLLSACGIEDDPTPPTDGFTVTASASAGAGGTINPARQTISDGDTAEFTVSPDTNFIIDTVSGCGGDLSYNADDDTYNTGPITANCTVTATFTRVSATVTTSANTGGTITPANQTVTAGSTARFTIIPDSGFAIDRVEGCDGELSTDNKTYTTGPVTGDCSITAVFAEFAGASNPTLSFAPVKLLRFNWTDAPGATHYRLLENPDMSLGAGFTQVGDDIAPRVETYDHSVPLYARVNAQYILQSCVNEDCYDSAPVSVSGTLVDSIGYFKASNSGEGDVFGASVSLNATGDTLAVGTPGEDGIAGDPDNNGALSSGAVYVFTHEDGRWNQQAYLKADNAETGDVFGGSVSLNGAGDTLARKRFWRGQRRHRGQW